MLRNWRDREKVKYLSIIIVISICYSLFFPPIAQVSAAEQSVTQQIINSMQQADMFADMRSDFRNLVVAENSPVTPDNVLRSNAGLNKRGHDNKASPEYALLHAGKREQSEITTDHTGRRIIGFHVNPQKRSILPARKTWSSHTVSTQSVPIVGFVIDPELKRVKPIKKAQVGTRTLVSGKQTASPSSIIENQCDVTAPARVLRHCYDDSESDCNNDAELWLSHYEFEYKEGNLLEIHASYKNITVSESFQQPFCFTVNEEETTLDKIEVITLPVPEELQNTFGDDKVLSPGEKTTVLTYSVVHKGEPFNLFIDANAVVESDTVCNVENMCEASGDSRMLELCNEESETNCGEGTELWMSTFKEAFMSDTLLEITASFKNITDTKIFQQPLCFTVNDETLCDKIDLITLPEQDALSNAFSDDGFLSPGETTKELTFMVQHRGDPFSFYIGANAVLERVSGPTVTINADPLNIVKGESTTLTWSSTEAINAEIDPGIGAVEVDGSMEVFPVETTTYTITVTGNGGTATASTTVVVNDLHVEFHLSQEADTGQIGDDLTTMDTVSLAGFTDANIAIDLYSDNDLTAPVASTRSDASGNFRFANRRLLLGENHFSVTATNLDGHKAFSSRTITYLPCDIDSHINKFSVPVGQTPKEGDNSQMFIPGAAEFIGTFVPLSLPVDSNVLVVAAVLDGDGLPDLITLSKDADEVIIFLDTNSGSLGPAVRYNSGAVMPTTIAVDNFIGNLSPDIAVGHMDGTVTFLEGLGDGTFILRPQSFVTGLGTIVDMTAADFDEDSDVDLAVSGTNQLTVLMNDDDALPVSPITNGSFANHLAGWKSDVTGHVVGDIPGSINGSGGSVLFLENSSFRITLQQTFIVPSSPETLSFDILSSNLEDPAGGVPDAFEASLLDSASNSLVSSFDSGATSFINLNPGDDISTATGVTFDGTRAILDISGLTPGTEATLFFDLIGNPPGTGSSIVLDDVEISPGTILADTFTTVLLPGPIGSTEGIGHCDTDSNDHLDIIVSDAGFNKLIIYNGDGTGAFVRKEIDVAGTVFNTQIKERTSNSLNAEATPFGDLFTGNVGIGDEDVYTLDFAAGQQVYFDVLEGDKRSFSWSLADSNGTDVFSSSEFGDQGPHRINQTGQHTLHVVGRIDIPESYQFQIFEVPESVTLPIAIGDVVNGSIDVPGEKDIYTFDAISDQRLYFDIQKGDKRSFGWSLIDPDGVSIIFNASQFVDQGPFVLKGTGRYTLTMDGTSDRRDSYQFQIFDVPDPVTLPIAVGDIVNGLIDVPGEIDIYTFDALSDQWLFFDVQSGDKRSFGWSLTDTNGVTIFTSSQFGDQGPFVLESTGLHTLTIDGSGDRRNSYQFQIFDVPDSVPQSIPFNTHISGSIVIPGQTQTYIFDAVEDQEILFDILFNNNRVLYTLTDPSGNTVFANTRGDQSILSLPLTGRYELVADLDQSKLGSFSFQVVDGSIAPTVPSSADLVVNNVTAPLRVIDNPAQIEVTWTVTNQGDVSTVEGQWYDRVLFTAGGATGTIENADLVNFSAGVLEQNRLLGPGESYSQTETFTFKDNFTGDFEVLVETDYDNRVFENLDEANNSSRAENLTAVYPEPRNIGGESIINVDYADGSQFPSGTTLSLTGQVNLLSESINALFAFDLSGSTSLVTDLDANFDGTVNDQDDLNNDGIIGDILDTEIGAIIRISNDMAARVDDLLVAAIPFARTSWPADLGPELLNQTFRHPRTGGTIPDFERALRSTDVINGFFSGIDEYRTFWILAGTNFQSPIVTIDSILARAPDADQQIVYFLTDGESTTGPTDAELESLANRGIIFHSYQITGDNVTDQLDDLSRAIDANSQSSGDSTLVADPNDLANVLLGTIKLAGVTVNGKGVESLDASGNFFASVSIQPGNNEFLIEAFDSNGKSIFSTVNIVGIDPNLPPGFTELQDITALSTISYHGSTFNRKSQTLFVDSLITNRGDDSLVSPVTVVFNPITPSTVKLDNPETSDPQGHPAMIFDDELGVDGIAKGETSQPVTLLFSNTTHDRFSINVTFFTSNSTAPYFSSTPITTAVVGKPYQYHAAASDAENHKLAYALTVSPEGMSVDRNSGMVLWTPVPSQVGIHHVELTVSDGHGGVARQNYQVIVWLDLPNRPPVFSSTPLTWIAGGNDYRYAPVVSDFDQDTLLYSLDEAPVGMSINASTGVVAFASPPDGRYNISIRVEDGKGGDAVQSYVLSVGSVSSNTEAPRILSIPSIIGAVSNLYLYFPLVQDNFGDTLSYSLAQAPVNMEIDSDTGKIMWTPDNTQVGPNVVLLRVDDTQGNFVTQFFTVEVSAVLQNLTPVIISTPSFLATQGKQYLYDAEARDGNGDTVIFELAEGPQGMAIDATTGMLAFTPDGTQLGIYRVGIRAKDPFGDKGLQTYDIDVRKPNTAPVFISVPVTGTTAGGTYRYKAIATDEEDMITYSLLTSPIGMTIDKRTGVIKMNTAIADIGDHPITVNVTDERGAVAEQVYTLTVNADTELPVVSVQLSSTVIEPGETVDIQISASDNTGVSTIKLEIDGVPTQLDQNNSATYLATKPGLFDVTGIATDSSGNTGMATQKLRVIDPADAEPPFVEITSPDNGKTVTYLTDIIGTVNGDSDLEFYRVEYARLDLVDIDDIGADNPNWVAFVSGKTDVIDNLLGVFDPTLLCNDDYVVRVVAQDFSGNIAIRAITLGVTGNAKLGQFSVEFTDLSIPLAGIPIEITRRYSTLDANDQDDFGYGWTLKTADANIRETIPLGLEGQVGFFGAEPFKIGTRVYLTDPDGRRVGFTFEPTIAVSLLGTVFMPHFTPDPGVFDQLEVDNVALKQRSDGTFGLFLVGFNYNPSTYRLIRKDGTIYNHDQFEGLQSVIDRNDNELVYTKDGIFHSTGVSIQFVRDSLGRIKEIIDPAGNKITYSYDPAGDLSSVRDQEALVTQFTYYDDPAHYLDEVIDPLDRTAKRTEYDENGRVIAVTDALGNRFEQLWDPSNFVGTFTGGRGQVTNIIYDERGNVLKQNDPLGGVFTWTYDGDDNETSTTDENGHETHFTYDDQGNRLTQKDALGGSTTWTYDEFSNITSFTNPLDQVETFGYDDNGNLVERINAAGKSASATYDDQGRITSIRDFNDNPFSFEYGISDQPTKLINPDGSIRLIEYNHFGQATRVVDETNISTTAVYDDRGRLINQRDDQGNEITHTYNRYLLASTTDPLNRTTRFEYDDADRLVRQFDPLGGKTEYSYDADGNRIMVTDPVGNTTTFVYDNLNRRTERIDPLGNISTFTYDPVGNETERIDRNGRRTTFQYDKLNRLLKETWFDTNDIVVRTIDSVYDAVGNRLSIGDSDSTHSFIYDELNRVIADDNFGTPNVPNTVLSYSYDANGNRISASDGTGVRVDSFYGKRNRLARKTWVGTGIDPARVDFSYDDCSCARKTQEDRFADVDGLQLVSSSNVEYDTLGRVSSITHTGSANVVLGNYLYTYDKASQVTGKTHHGQTFDYTYDLTGQLIASSRSLFGNESFTYDANGNRTSNGSIVEDNNQIVVDNEFAYTYDDEGNLTSKLEIATDNISNYSYDHRNRLVRYEKRNASGEPTSEARYSYDALNRLIGMKVNGVTMYTIYDGANAWADFDEDGNVITRYLFGDRIDENLARYRPGEGTSWYLSDKLGTVSDLIDDNGDVINHIDYDSFGRVRGQTNLQVSDRFLFTGRELDEESGLYYYRARYYDSNLGRFLSQDPIGFDAGDANLYRYVNNAPFNATDPTGEAVAIEYQVLSGDDTGTVQVFIAQTNNVAHARNLFSAFQRTQRILAKILEIRKLP